MEKNVKGKALHFKCAAPLLCCESEVVCRLRRNGRADILWFVMVLRPFKLDFTQGWWPLPAALNNLLLYISKSYVYGSSPREHRFN